MGLFFFFFFVVVVICYHPYEFPKGIPHMSTMDDEYNGFYIPKGTLVFGNAWLVATDLILFFCPE